MNRKTFLTRIVPLALAAMGIGTALVHSAAPAEARLGHMVFFTLKDDTPENRAKLVAGCQKYLTGHPGTESFSVGTLAEDMKRDVNDRDFDVALHLVFKSKSAHDTYQSAGRHQQFISECEPLWAKVRVFDSYLAP